MKDEPIVVVDQAKCTGCNLCRLSCSIEMEGTCDPRKSRVTVPGEDRVGFSPQLCRHCQEPPCLDACPAGAIVRGDGGRILLLEERCRGCNMCVMVCPFNAVVHYGAFYRKCGSCQDPPQCETVCLQGALRFTTAAREAGRKRRALAKRLTAACISP